MADLNSVDFGNPLLTGLKQIEIPASVSWWPETAGWLVFGACVCLFIMWLAVHRFRRWQADAYRRQYLAQLDRLIADSGGDPGKVAPQLAPLLKATALQAYQRRDVAALSGRPWLEFLDAHYSGPRFLSEAGETLIRITYERDAANTLEAQAAHRLVEMSKAWISRHRRGKRIAA